MTAASSGVGLFVVLVVALGSLGTFAWHDSGTKHSGLTVEEDCSNFNGQDTCRGQQVDEPASFDARRWQTPPRGDALWHEPYQDFNRLVGYARVTYDDTKRQAASVHVFTLRPDNSTTLTYYFNDVASKDPIIDVDATSSPSPLHIRVEGSDGAVLELDDVDFVWSAPSVVRGPEWESGQKGSIVELFGWPYDDIAAECAMLGKAGYLGVKVYPPQESVLSDEWPQAGERNPWWFLYQPVSYRLYSRMGTRDQLRDMINTCRRAGVRVYADAVVNHMSGGGNDVLNHRNSAGGSCTTWGPKSSAAGSPYFTAGFAFQNNTWTHQHPSQEYPAVPYGPRDFHCERVLSDWNSGFSLNYGWLVGLSDLNSESAYVRQRIADYFTSLLGIGFSGFRIDAAKHIAPDNLAAIFNLLRQNMGGSLPDDFISYLEVLIGGEKDLLECTDNSYSYGQYFANALATAGLSAEDIAKIKIWESDYPKEFPICGSWVIPSERFAIQNDDHDQQNPGSTSRDMGDKGSILVKDKDVAKHRSFEEQLFRRTDGNWKIRLVLSGYTFMENGAMGFPDGKSDCAQCKGDQCASCTKSMAYSKAHDDTVCGYTVYDANGSWGQGVYTRVHRDKSIIIAMRDWMGLPTDVPNKDLGLPDSCA